MGRSRMTENKLPDGQADWTPGLVLKHMTAISIANDQRYQERFAAQEKAVKDALAAQEKAVNAALAASEKAVLVAENNAQKWRENANEWRAAMTDRERNFATQGDFKAIKERVDRGEGSGKGMRDMWALIAGGILLLIAIATFIVSHVKL